MSASQFATLPLLQRYKECDKHGSEIAQRTYQAYNIMLVYLHDFYVEVWRRMGIGPVVFIELIDKKRIAEIYAPHIQLKF